MSLAVIPDHHDLVNELHPLSPPWHILDFDRHAVREGIAEQLAANRRPGTAGRAGMRSNVQKGL
jgi:hypothetical protein